MIKRRRMSFILIAVAVIVYFVFVLFSSHSPAYNEWQDKRAYTKLTQHLSHGNIEKIIFSIQQQAVVKEHDPVVLKDISYGGSLGDQEHATLKVDTMIIEVVLFQAENIILRSDDLNSNVFKVYFNERTFSVGLPNLNNLANEVMPLFKGNPEPLPEQPSIKIK